MYGVAINSSMPDTFPIQVNGTWCNGKAYMKILHTLNLKKIDVNALDFERLTESQMQFRGRHWEKQQERFDQELDFNHEYIFWVESYASLILATHYLDQVGHAYAISYDSAVDMWCFTTDYPSTWSI